MTHQTPTDPRKCLLRGTLQRDLYNRMRGRPYYSPDDYARVFADHEGQEVEVTRIFSGPGGPYAYNVTLSGKTYHCPRLYIDVEGIDR